MMPSILLVLTNLPDTASAEQLAATLVEARLVACATILAPCQSIYRWRGAVEKAQEVPLLLKTSSARYPEVESAIRSKHPYELPEIIAFPIQTGLPAYLRWVFDETEESSCLVC